MEMGRCMKITVKFTPTHKTVTVPSHDVAWWKIWYKPPPGRRNQNGSWTFTWKRRGNE